MAHSEVQQDQVNIKVTPYFLQSDQQDDQEDFYNNDTILSASKLDTQSLKKPRQTNYTQIKPQISPLTAENRYIDGKKTPQDILKGHKLTQPLDTYNTPN